MFDKIRHIDAEIARLQADRARIIAEGEWPKFNAQYFSTCANGTIQPWLWQNDDQDQAMFNQGNVFWSRYDAEQELKARAIITKYRNQPGRCEFTLGKPNWYVQLDNYYLSVEREDTVRCGPFQVYFETREACTSALAAVGTDDFIFAITHSGTFCKEQQEHASLLTLIPLTKG